MTLVLPDIAEWIARLDGLADLDRVGGSLDLYQDLADPQFNPGRGAAYPLYHSDKARANETMGGIGAWCQESVEMVAVVFLVPNYPTLDAAHDLVLDYPEHNRAGDAGLRIARQAVFNRLLNWRPDGADGPVAFVDGERLSGFDAGLILWQDNYSMPYRLAK